MRTNFTNFVSFFLTKELETEFDNGNFIEQHARSYYCGPAMSLIGSNWDFTFYKIPGKLDPQLLNLYISHLIFGSFFSSRHQLQFE